MEGPTPTSMWPVLEVPGGGWIRFNRRLQRADAHCLAHRYADCKMDRRLTKGSLGLSMAWLAAGPTCTHLEHVLLKSDLSHEDGRAARLEGRERLRVLGETMPLARDLLQCEADARSNDWTEPKQIHCPVSIAEIARAMKLAEEAEAEAAS